MRTDGRIRRVAPPPESRIADWYRTSGLLDSYAVPFARPDGMSMRQVAERALSAPPAWFNLMIRIRDGIVGPLGIKTSSSMRREQPDDERIDFFPVLAVYPDEIILGEDDRHLDFRLSVLCRDGPDGAQVVATTAVRVHNLLGRIYLLVITPFHVLVVKSTLRRLARTAQPPLRGQSQ